VNAKRTPFHRARARYVLREAPMIHVDAANLAEAAVELGADPRSVWTRAWGVDTVAFQPDGRPAAPGGREPLRILWTRQLEPVYDPEPFVRALGLLKLRAVPFRATLAGSGPLRPSVEAWIREEGVAEEVALEGFVGEDRLRELYRSADRYVSISRSDSTSQSLLEAMSSGLLPIVTDIAGNREWVTHRREGYLVPVGDAEALACAIQESAHDPESGAMRARARARVLERGSFADTLAQLDLRLRALAGGSA
jgi:glycosyltransferase involved in cell wall biosynthesis